MIFGKPSDFAIEAYHEPSGPEYGGYGRMCIHVQGMQIGDLHENHCSLHHATQCINELIGSIETQWDTTFVGLSDCEIFDLLSRGLYEDHGQTLEQMNAEWQRLCKYVFLTNTGEQFDDFNTFIICQPEGVVTVIYRFKDDTLGSGSCRIDSFRSVAKAYVQWFEEQVRNIAPPFFPANPFNPEERVSDNWNF